MYLPVIRLAARLYSMYFASSSRYNWPSLIFPAPNPVCFAVLFNTTWNSMWQCHGLCHKVTWSVSYFIIVKCFLTFSYELAGMTQMTCVLSSIPLCFWSRDNFSWFVFRNFVKLIFWVTPANSFFLLTKGPWWEIVWAYCLKFLTKNSKIQNVWNVNFVRGTNIHDK